MYGPPAVASISPATGAEFSVLPAQNSSGNWIKVVQRVTVRLKVEQFPDGPPLRAGMSTNVDIDTGRSAPWPALVRRAEAVRSVSADAGPPDGDAERGIITLCVMLATIMQALDMTIANVALPYMQGSLSATQDQINWVLTSYIVSAAIVMPMTGFLAARFGRKKLFLTSVAGFTATSVLCGMAQTIEQMVLFRLLQGVFGAPLVPMSQSVLLDRYPTREDTARRWRCGAWE